METAIRWSPSSTLSEQRFLLVECTGRSFNKAKVIQYDGKNIKHDLLSTYRKVPPFRAFDWAPFDESLVAVGQWSGEATILRIDDSAAPVSLPTKHQRLCNAVSFSKTGLLATGLERVRNVECLNLWDANQRLTSIPSPGGRAGKSVEPYRKFSSSEAISSIKFFARQPDVLVAGVKGVGIRVYDLRDNTGNPSLHFQTIRTHNIAIDPLNENYFGCAGTGKDTTIQVWDSRTGSPYTAPATGATGDQSHQVSPVVEYTEAFATSKNGTQANIWSLRYCKGKSGVLGALSSNGEFKVFETSHDYSRANSDSNVVQPASSPSSERLLTKRIHGIERAFDDGQQPRQESERIVAFDFTNLAGSKGTPSAIILRGNAKVSVQELSGPPTAFDLSPLGALTVSKSYQLDALDDNDEAIRTYVPGREEKIAALPGSLHKTGLDKKQPEQVSLRDLGALRRGLQSSHEAHEQAVGLRARTESLKIEEALASITVTRTRCAEGYGLNVEKNIEILGSENRFRFMWVWIERAQKNSRNNGMIARGLDLSYLGVLDIWKSDMRSDQVLRRLSNPNVDADFADAIIALAHSLDLPKFTSADTDAPEHRQVCLHICGLGLAPQQVEDTVKRLISDGEKTKAAALAIIHDSPKLALQALRAGEVSATQRELSLALAGYAKGSTDETWHETIQDLASDLEDPYARAILALVGHGDWHDVLKETSLSLPDRVGIALMYLSDDELTQYINTATAQATKQGDIEGVVLTGLSLRSLPLFETYIAKFSDLQTAVLALAFASPRYFIDPRVTIWRQTYRSQLDRFGLFLQRAQFDIQSTKLSTTPSGEPTLPLPARQISIRCTYCEQNLDRNPQHGPAASASASHGVHQGSIFGFAAKSGTVCPKCGRHMPRCVICMNWVGMPDAHTKGEVAKKMGKEEMMDKFVSVCHGCWHVSHAGHAEEWFRRHRVCPASGCECRCVEVDVGVG